MKFKNVYIVAATVMLIVVSLVLMRSTGRLATVSGNYADAVGDYHSLMIQYGRLSDRSLKSDETIARLKELHEFLVAERAEKEAYVQEVLSTNRLLVDEINRMYDRVEVLEKEYQWLVAMNKQLRDQALQDIDTSGKVERGPIYE